MLPRLFASILLLVTLAAVTPAQESEFLPETFKVGQSGEFQEVFRFRIDRILDARAMIVQLGVMPRFVVRGLPTADLAEDQKIPLRGRYRIAKTEKIDGRTYFVAEHLPAKK